MTAVQPPDIDPLKGHHKYQRLRHLSGGACGFVVLAIDKSTGDLVRAQPWSYPNVVTDWCDVCACHGAAPAAMVPAKRLYLWSVGTGSMQTLSSFTCCTADLQVAVKLIERNSDKITKNVRLKPLLSFHCLSLCFNMVALYLPVMVPDLRRWKGRSSTTRA